MRDGWRGRCRSATRLFGAVDLACLGSAAGCPAMANAWLVPSGATGAAASDVDATVLVNGICRTLVSKTIFSGHVCAERIRAIERSGPVSAAALAGPAR